MNSIHGKLDKVRKPRVHITYDVETEGATVKKELPFVVGVLGDFSGQPSQPLRPFKDRKFVQIDADNFNEVMRTFRPELNFSVKNTLKNDDTELSVNLHFHSMEDFEPAKVAEQVEPLKKLIALRQHLSELINKVDRSEQLESLLESALQESDQIKLLANELGINSEAEATSTDAADASEKPSDNA